MKSKPIFFENQDQFRKWLRDNHKNKTELWVGFCKKDSGLPSMTWPESVDQALCYGWIDGLRKSIDEKRYKIRFTPRKPKSNWSDVNINKIKELKKKRLLRAAGLAAYEKRKEAKSRAYTYEKPPCELSKEYESRFRKNNAAWEHFENGAPGYKKQVIGWIMSAKKEETRLRRLNILIKHCAEGQKIPQVDWRKSRENED